MKGDATKYQNQMNFQGGLAQNNLNNQWARNAQQNSDLWNTYQTGVGKNLSSYDEIMQNYRNIMANQQANPSANIFDEERAGYANLAGGGGASNLDEVIGRYRNFADTGGFSTQDLQNLRARAIAPTRAIYQQGQNQLQRAKGLSGGTMSNFGATQAKLAREMSHAIGDANVNANASIAGAVQQGKLAGIGGMGSTQLAVDKLNNELKLAGLGGMTDVDKARLAGMLADKNEGLAATQGMTQLYGATPGLANVFGNQVLESSQQGLGLQGLQNQLANMMINAQLNRSQIPSNYQQALGNIGGTLGLAGQVGSVLGGLKGGSNYGNMANIFGKGGETGYIGNDVANVATQSQQAGNSPWWKSILGGIGGGGTYNPYSGNPNIAQFDPYLGILLGGGSAEQIHGGGPKVRAF